MLSQEAIQTEVTKGKKFETHSWPIKILRVISIPVINHLPSSLLKKAAKSSSHDAKKIINTVGSTHALEVMYTRHQRRLFARGIFQGVADFFWHHVISQLKAIRNRLKIIESSLEEELETRIQNGEHIINMLTVGGGSCRATIQTTGKLRTKYPEVKIKVTNIDKDPQATELGREIARNFKVEDRFQWVNDSASNIRNIITADSVDIVEMVGLMDYFWEEKAVKVLNQIYETLKPGGFLIVANIHPNREMRFVKNVGWPEMCYRTQDEFIKVIRDAGFVRELKVVFEPLKIHIIGLARK